VRTVFAGARQTYNHENKQIQGFDDSGGFFVSVLVGIVRPGRTGTVGQGFGGFCDQ